MVLILLTGSDLFGEKFEYFISGIMLLLLSLCLMNFKNQAGIEKMKRIIPLVIAILSVAFFWD